MGKNFILEDKEEGEIEMLEAHVGKGWLLTFTDLVSLLLAFFVLLFSMSNVVKEEWESVTEALSRSLQPDVGMIKSKPGADLSISGKQVKIATDLGYLSALLEAQTLENPRLKETIIHSLENRIVISLPSDLLFPSGQAVLSEAGRAAMNEMGTLLRNVKNTVLVFGHTDSTPPSGRAFTSNWELSLARAISVANELRRAGYPKEITAFGAAESQSGAISSGFSGEKRLALARRVDIVVESTQ